MTSGRHHGVELLSSGDMERIYRVTDGLDLHRDWVVVPMDTVPDPVELLHPDGKLLIHAPGSDRFEEWLRGLRGRLLRMELGRIPRRGERDPKFPLTGPGELPPVGTRGYLGRMGILR